MLLCSVSFGQNHYTPVPVDNAVYNMSMTIATTVSFEGTVENRDNLELGVFCNGVCRATTMTKDYGTGQYIALTTFRGKSGEEYTLKVYDHNNSTEHSNYVLSDADGNEFVDNTISFNADFFGNPVAPYNVNFIAPDHFIPEIGDYENNMTLTAVVLIDGVEQKNAKLELGAFIGDKVVGSSKTDFKYTINEERFYANQMGIAGNDNNVVTFKLYDHENGEELEFLEVNSITFETNKFLGTIAEPIKIDFLTKSYVAQIGETKYETLAAAVEAATAGQTINLRKDAEGSGVVINKNLTIDFGGFTYTFNEGEVISIQEGGVATFVNDANITEGVELFGGQLYTTNDNLTIVAKKHFNPVSGDVGATEGWGTISTPIASVEIPSNDNHDIYSYDEKNAMWRFYKEGEGVVSHFDEFELGQGYLYANKEDITIELTGTLNVEPVELDITYTEGMNELAGFNFVGNPFAHNISEAHFATTNGAQLSNGFYVVSPEGAIVVRPANAVIAPMESVMVQTDAKTKLTIKNAPASKRSEINNGQLEINVANSNYSDVAYVSFNEGRGLNKIGHRNAEIPMVYVPVDGANYAIAMMNEDVTEIPVSFQAATMGQYTIGVEAQDCEYAMMTLVDRFTGIETNLLLEDYTFIAKSNDSAERFIIKLAMDNSNGEANENFAFINNGMMYIYNIEGQGTVSVYDVTGRPVAEYNVATSANISTSDFAAGMYIIRMSDENGVKVQKIVVE